MMARSGGTYREITSSLALSLWSLLYLMNTNPFFLPLGSPKEIIHPNGHSEFCTSSWYKSVLFYSLYGLLKSEHQNWRRSKKKKNHSPILLIPKEAELQKGKTICRADGGVGMKIQVSQVHSFSFLFFYNTLWWIQKTSYSFLFPRLVGGEVKWVGKAEKRLMRGDFISFL